MTDYADKIIYNPKDKTEEMRRDQRRITVIALKEKNRYQNIYFKILLFAALALISCFSGSIQNKKALPRYGFDPKYETAIDSILNLMTLDEKIAMIHGSGTFVSSGVARLGIPDLYYSDGPNGIRGEMERNSWKPLNLTTDSVTFFPTGTALAATWNTKLAFKYGKAIGKEARARGKDILLGPAINIIRTPLDGREFEYFTEDPYLNGQMAIGYVRGVQDEDVAACVKHYVANNQETNRSKINVMMDERTLREIYLPGFKAAVQEADARAIMGAYNKFRGEYLCQNSYLNNQLLKKDLGFKGIVISDWNATHNTMKAALGGLDVEMGTKAEDYNHDYMADPLRDSVLAGKVPVKIINDKVRRILRLIYNNHMMDPGRIKGEKCTPAISRVAFDVASEAIVLLKNDNKILPLDANKIKTIAVIGENAVQIQSKGGFTAGVKARYEITPLEGLEKRLKGKVIVRYAEGYVPKMDQEDPKKWWIKYPDTIPDENLINQAAKLASETDVAIVFAGDNREVESEGRDRRSIKLPFGQDALIKAVTAANPRTIVVVVAGAACDLNIAKQYSPAILYSWFNGSEAGNAIAGILFGDVNPSGKLPFTIPVHLKDIAAHALNAYPGKDLQLTYKEGILVGYRWFDTKNITPLYPFGYGLSYTTFHYDDLKTDKSKYDAGDTIRAVITVSNTGHLAGKETVECYVHANKSQVLRPEKELKAFSKVLIGPGESRQVKLNICARDLSYFSDSLKTWVLEPGDYTLLVGASSRNILKKAIVHVE